MENVIDALQRRGLVESITGDEIRELTEKPIRIYCGFDPTADSLHLGNMVALMALAYFQRHGHTPVALVGGATGMIGDPSGKKSERKLLDAETIEKNLKGIRKNLEAFLDFNHPTAKPIIVNNYDWLGKFTFIEFLRDVGKYFRMGPMLAKESVRQRLSSEEGMSFTEFSYQILQGYDFLHLYRDYGVKLQVGGSDQWGNIVGGTDLVRKVEGQAVHGLTLPLLLDSEGNKFGKSEKGTIWLAKEKLSPYEFYQKLYAVSDKDVINLLRMLTFLDIVLIEEMESAMSRPDYIPNTAQKLLAEEVTRIVHGEGGLEVAKRATACAKPGSETLLDVEALENVANDIPNVSLKKSEVVGCKIIDLYLMAGAQNSKGEVRRLIRNGGAYLNNEKIEDENAEVQEGTLIGDKMLLLGVGKKKKILIRLDSGV